MGYRFSLKWLLAGTVYAAIAAAAFAQAHWSYADILWIATFFAVTYALSAAIFARGPRRGAATGFAIANLLMLVCLQYSPESLPTSRLIAAAMPVIETPSAPSLPALTAYAPMPAPPTASVTVPYTVVRVLPDGRKVSETRTRVVTPTPAAPAYYPQPVLAAPAPTYDDGAKFGVRIRAGNAVGTMFAGLVGGVLGAAAFRRGRSGDPRPLDREE